MLSPRTNRRANQQTHQPTHPPDTLSIRASSSDHLVYDIARPLVPLFPSCRSEHKMASPARWFPYFRPARRSTRWPCPPAGSLTSVPPVGARSTRSRYNCIALTLFNVDVFMILLLLIVFINNWIANVRVRSRRSAHGGRCTLRDAAPRRFVPRRVLPDAAAHRLGLATTQPHSAHIAEMEDIFLIRTKPSSYRRKELSPSISTCFV